MTVGTGCGPKSARSARPSPDGGRNRVIDPVHSRNRIPAPVWSLSTVVQFGAGGTKAAPAVRPCARAGGFDTTALSPSPRALNTASLTNDQNPIRCQHAAPQKNPATAAARTLYCFWGAGRVTAGAAASVASAML